ncbi:MAG: signal peptidase II [Tyzzerella sp.]|nr:signal peptidase II [Tyzzerella sp.]
MEKKQQSKKLFIISILCVIVGIILDQYTKFLASSHLKEAPISIIDGVFELRYLENRGAAFGMLQNQQWFFLIIGTVFMILIAVLYARLPQEKRLLPLRICMVLIAAGAVGNMIDRVRLNYVIDFLYFKLIDFPIFNVADIYVTVATFAVVLLILFYYKEEELDQFFGKISRKHKVKAEQEQ